MMHKTTKQNSPTWAKILFEAPEYIYELLYNGTFPKFRKNVIESFLKVLVFCEKQRKHSRGIKWVESKTHNIIEWINNNWKKTYFQNRILLSSYVSMYNIAENAPLIEVKLASVLDSICNQIGIDQIE